MGTTCVGQDKAARNGSSSVTEFEFRPVVKRKSRLSQHVNFGFFDYLFGHGDESASFRHIGWVKRIDGETDQNNLIRLQQTVSIFLRQQSKKKRSLVFFLQILRKRVIFLLLLSESLPYATSSEKACCPCQVRTIALQRRVNLHFPRKEIDFDVLLYGEMHFSMPWCFVLLGDTETSTLSAHYACYELQ